MQVEKKNKGKKYLDSQISLLFTALEYEIKWPRRRGLGNWLAYSAAFSLPVTATFPGKAWVLIIVVWMPPGGHTQTVSDPLYLAHATPVIQIFSLYNIV